jgi:hypothetical protein
MFYLEAMRGVSAVTGSFPPRAHERGMEAADIAAGKNRLVANNVHTNLSNAERHGIALLTAIRLGNVQVKDL